MDQHTHCSPDQLMPASGHHPVQGRGAVDNPTGRFESIEVVHNPEEDWPETLPTQVFKEEAKSIVTFNDSPDVGFQASVNPYRGCEHGCIYCYARPTHEYMGLSAGLDFETKLFAKTNAPQLLRKALSAKSWKPQVIAMSGVTDCYQPIERQLKLTRQCLEVLAEFRNPVAIVTKNHLVTRDIDILGEMASYQGAGVFLSVTTLDESLARTMEPRTSRPSLRISALAQLHEAGIPVGVLMGPIISGLTDHEIHAILKQASEAGARSAYYTMLRLPYGVKSLFQNWLETHYPQRKSKIMNHIMDVRDGQLNNTEFGTRMTGAGQYAQTIAQMFELYKKRFGLEGSIGPLSADQFRRNGTEQLKLF